ncbi:MAG: aldose epimerase family protein [Pseudomonadota bacterium]
MEPFGTLDDELVHRITIGNPDGMRAVILTYGAALAEMWVPDRAGRLADVVLGWDKLEDYVGQRGCFGATCGRYANRIADGRFLLDGVPYQLDVNEGPTTLHGGPRGFHKQVWQVLDRDTHHVTLGLLSPDGDQGFPGRLSTTVTYRISGGALYIVLNAASDVPTIINLVNHAYWNLGGHDALDVLDHTLQVNALHYLPVDDRKIPTGEIAPVADTAFDFRVARPVGFRVNATPAGYYDHNWCLDIARGEIGPALVLSDPESGRAMSVSTTEPGVQLYSAAHLDGSLRGKGGIAYPRAAGLAIETQNWPDAPNQAGFPTFDLRPDETYDHTIRYAFSAH